MAGRRRLRQAMTHSPRRDQPLIPPPGSTSLLPFIPPCAVSPFTDKPRVFGFSITRLLRGGGRDLLIITICLSVYEGAFFHDGIVRGSSCEYARWPACLSVCLSPLSTRLSYSFLFLPLVPGGGGSASGSVVSFDECDGGGARPLSCVHKIESAAALPSASP